jgi:ankyrin repeat protein
MAYDLITPSMKGDIDTVRRLLEEGADVNAKTNYDEKTALMYASIYGQTEIAKLLLEKGADVNAKDYRGTTAFILASLNGRTEIAKLFLEKGADVNARENDGTTALISASKEQEEDNTEIVKFLLEKGADVNAKDNDGFIALMYATMYGQIDIVKILLMSGADINAKDNNGENSLKHASANGDTEIVKLLLEKGADINAKDNEGTTALMKASENGDREIVKLLLEKGANVNAKDNNGQTALDLAKNDNIKKLLRGKEELWKGMTRSDISHLDAIFSEEVSDHSICPICLQYGEREDGCMYMTHDCTKHGKQYHNELYQIYKNSDGQINWCTICNRIAKGHNHFKLADVTTTTPSVIIEPGNPHEKDCSRTSGGGGPKEKLARFRRFREYVLELQDDIGKKGKQEAFEELVEEVWNAPLRREGKLLKKIQNNKAWNISSSAFPLPTENVNNVAPNIPYNGPLPTKVNSGRNNIMMNNNIPVLRFVHQQPDGSEQTHGISEENLKTIIENSLGKFGGEGGAGYCFMYPDCKARLYPQEIKDYIPELLYNRYKKLFNQKFKTASGGGSEDLIQEANDFMCVNLKRGGRRNTKRRRYSKKTKKAKKTKSRRL